MARPNLPAPPATFGRAVEKPKVVVGKSLRVFAAENRAALNTANYRLESDRQFYDAVRREFGEGGNDAGW